MAFQTEFTFTLPRGYIDDTGVIHRKGPCVSRMQRTEILPLKDPRVQQNPGYLTIILLARVITKLGSLPAVDTRTVEKLFTMDLAYLSGSLRGGSTQWRCRPTRESVRTAERRSESR
ncbi:MAG: phage tail assembly protein [Clostridiaceae bacterium]